MKNKGTVMLFFFFEKESLIPFREKMVICVEVKHTL